MSLAHKITTKTEAKIWAASYDTKRNAFRISPENGLSAQGISEVL